MEPLTKTTRYPAVCLNPEALTRIDKLKGLLGLAFEGQEISRAGAVRTAVDFIIRAMEAQEARHVEPREAI